MIESHKQNSVNVFKASLWRRLIGKALQAGRLGGRLASDWYGVRLTTMASGSRRNRARRAPYGDGHGRKTRAREKGRGKCRRAGKHRARGRLGARGERSAGEIRGQREERSQGRRTYLLARANVFAHATGRSCYRRGSPSPSPVPHPREEQPPAGCCFPVASSGPPLSRTRAASPLPSLFPTHTRSSRRRTAVSPPPPLVNIEQEQDPSRLLQSSLEPGTLLLLCIFLASSV